MLRERFERILLDFLWDKEVAEVSGEGRVASERCHIPVLGIVDFLGKVTVGFRFEEETRFSVFVGIVCAVMGWSR